MTKSCHFLILALVVAVASAQRYDPTWESLDTRVNPAWFDQDKIGIFVHWGVYSVPSIFSEWFWFRWKEGNPDLIDFMAKNYPPGFEYADFAAQFTAEFYKPDEWAALFQKAGAKYVVLTSKHHEGYALYPSKYSYSWNAGDVGPHRDLVGDLADAIRANTDIRFGLYHSRYEWFNPLYIADRENGYHTTDFVDFKTYPELYELVEKYQPDVVWSDGEWYAADDYWKSRDFLAWLYSDSPVKDSVVTNDRWGNNTKWLHGGFWSGDDGYNPGVLNPHKFENCFSLDKRSWGYRRDAKIEDYFTPEELTRAIAETVSCGGNVLINVGPTKEGTIPPIQQERLLQLGEWLGINGDAIYNTVPHTVQNDTTTPGVWYTRNNQTELVYAIITSSWPPGGSIQLGSVSWNPDLGIEMLGSPGVSLWYTQGTPGIMLTLPHPTQVTSKWAWVLAIKQF